MKKKIGLIIGIIAFIGAMVGITIGYYKTNGSEEELIDEAVDLGIIKVTDESFEKEVLKSDKLVVVDFYENNCPPCTSMIPTIINISKSSEDVKVVMMNLSDSDTTKTSGTYGVSASPTILIIKGGEVIDGFVGATSEDNIMTVINKELENKNEK